MQRVFLNILTIALLALFAVGDVSCGIGEAKGRNAVMQELTLSFEWQGSGCQLSFPNPELQVSGVPKGTAFLRVRMTDLDKPDFNHGGGTVPYDGTGVVGAGALSDYRGPCPPSGSHTYRFDVEALGADKSSVLGRGTISKRYP